MTAPHLLGDRLNEVDVGYLLVEGASGLIRYANAAADKMFGGALVGRQVDDLANFPGHAAARAKFGGEGPRRMGARTIKGKGVDGRPLFLAVGLSALPGGNVEAVIRDCTATARSERLLELGLDLARTATDGLHFDYLSPSWTDALGWSLDELLSLPFVEFVHPEDQEATAAMAADMLDNGGLAVLFRNRYRHKDGRWVWLEWVGRVVDRIFWASARDVTRLVEAEGKLAAQKRDLEQFAYAAAHDLKAPLRRVSSLASSAAYALDQLAPGVPPEEGAALEKLRRRLQQLRDAGEHGASIVEAALDYARAGGEVECRLQDVEPAVDRVLVGLRGMRLTTSGPEGTRARFHAETLQAVLANLLDNARKYAPGGSIRVSWGDSEDGGAWIAVDDDGRGWPSEFQARLFEPTWRGATDVPGHGFGLAKVRRLVDSMGAEITASSPGEGKGATFLLELRA